MRVDTGKLSEIGSWLLAFCAFVTTILVVYSLAVHRSTTTASSAPQWEAKYVDEWQAALSVGFRSGPVNAPVQVIEFADFQCPYCARFETTVQEIRDKYPEQVAFTFAHFPLTYHDFAETAARAAECADAAGRFEEMRSMLFERQQEFGSTPWLEFARQAGISNVERFDACVRDTRPVERIQRAMELADTMGVRGTPTVFVNGWKMPVPPSSDHFEIIIKNVAEGKPPAEDLLWN